MKSFNQFIAEAFDSTYEWEWRNQDSDRFFARFETKDGDTIHVSINKAVGVEDQWTLTFFQNGSSDVETGRHDALKILSTVLVISRNFINMMDPYLLAFHVEKSGIDRESVYKKMLRRFTPKGYKPVKINRKDNTPGTKTFGIVKK